MSKVFKLNNFSKELKPYSHYIFGNILSIKDYSILVKWVQNYQNWNIKEESFYKFYSKYLGNEDLNSEINSVVNPGSLKDIVDCLAEILNTSFKDEVYISINRMDQGHEVMNHNDFFSDPNSQYYFTHRFLLYLNPLSEEIDGGELVLTNKKDDNLKQIKTLGNTGVLLIFNDESFHKVNQVLEGSRYCFVISLKELRDAK